MHFSAVFFVTVFLVLPVFAVSTALVDVVKVPGKTSGKHIVTLKSRNTTIPFVHANSTNVTHRYNIINGIAGNFTDQQIEELRVHPDVEAIYEDGTMETATLQTNATWGLARLDSKTKLDNQDTFFMGFEYDYNEHGGEGVDIYTVDTGINVEHVEFGGRARWGATIGNYPHKDNIGHGTHSAGAAVGRTFGVAKKANVIAVRVFENETAYNSDILAGLDYVYKASQASGRPSVASLSFAGDKYKPIDDAVTRLTDENVIVVAAAGNHNTDASNISPACVPSAITVAASNIADEQASFSNYGEVIDIFAPGERILSAWIGDHEAMSHCGTSVATAQVSGLVATLLSSIGHISPSHAKKILKEQAMAGVLSHVSSNTPNLLVHSVHAGAN